MFGDRLVFRRVAAGQLNLPSATDARLLQSVQAFTGQAPEPNAPLLSALNGC